MLKIFKDILVGINDTKQPSVVSGVQIKCSKFTSRYSHNTHKTVRLHAVKKKKIQNKQTTKNSIPNKLTIPSAVFPNLSKFNWKEYSLVQNGLANAVTSTKSQGSNPRKMLKH